jgi:type IV pilus assembly protein PilE
MTLRTAKGFTLLELMTVIVVVAILVAIAVPGYQSQAKKARRQAATTTLQDLAMRQNKWRADHATYGSLADIGGAASDENYTYSVTVNDAANFTLEAEAKSDGAQRDDTDCLTLTYEWVGANRAATKEPEECW